MEETTATDPPTLGVSSIPNTSIADDRICTPRSIPTHYLLFTPSIGICQYLSSQKVNRGGNDGAPTASERGSFADFRCPLHVPCGTGRPVALSSCRGLTASNARLGGGAAGRPATRDLPVPSLFRQRLKGHRN